MNQKIHPTRGGIKRFLEKWSLSALIFLLPSQLAIHLWPSWAFVFGIRVDYLAPAIYATDILATILFTLWIVRDNVWIAGFLKKYYMQIMAVGILAILNLIFSTSFYVSLLRWLKVLEFSLLATYIFRTGLLKESEIIKTLFISAAFFSFVGIFQFYKQATLGGLFYFLGERTFYASTPGIALVNIFGRELLRAYSTFSHPNSLAGYLGVILILVVNFRKLNVYKGIGAIVISTCFILAFSINAFISLGLTVFLRFVLGKKVLKKLAIPLFGLVFFLSLAMPIVSKEISLIGLPFGQNVSQRLDLSFVSGKMISERFLVGEGLNTFAVNIPKFKGITAYSWLLQPVHNIYLLAFAEVGITGLLIFCLAMYKNLLRILQTDKTVFLMVFIFVIFTGFLDHYWLTLQQNFLLLSLLVGLSSKIDA